MRFSKKSARKEATQSRLLPIDAYPAHIDEAGRDRVDKRLREKMHTIPVDPGPYLDNEGKPWTLDSDGAWADKHGTSRSSPYTPILASFGPFTRVEVPSRG